MSIIHSLDNKENSNQIILHPNVIKKDCLESLIRHSFELQKIEARLFTIEGATKWFGFVEKLYEKNPRIPPPFYMVKILVQKYLGQFNSTRPVLDIGCETGKNALCLIQAGHMVTLIDIASNAVWYTMQNLKKMHMNHGVAETIVGKIENLDSRQGPFKAVVGTYAFSFIPPELFQTVMKKNILFRIESGGYFAGGFFGPEHVWANDPCISTVTIQKLRKIFTSAGFSICEIQEKKENKIMISNGRQFFHTIDVIAKRL